MSPAAPAISVVIPAWNAAAWLGQTLDSVLAQTLPAAEILVIDDGSTDDTAAIAARHAPRVRCLRQANAGQAAARNRGVAESLGEFIAFLDSDDLWLPGKLQAQWALAQADPGIGLVFSNYEGFGPMAGPPAFERPGGQALQRCAQRTLAAHGHLVTEAAVLAAMMDSLFIQVPSVWFVRRAAFDAVGGFREQFRRGGEDWLFACELAALGWRFAFDDRILARRREWAGSHSKATALAAAAIGPWLELARSDKVSATDQATVQRRVATAALDTLAQLEAEPAPRSAEADRAAAACADHLRTNRRWLDRRQQARLAKWRAFDTGLRLLPPPVRPAIRKLLLG